LEPLTIHLVLFSVHSDEPVILSESNDKDLAIMSNKNLIINWLDMTVTKINRQWGARAYWAMEMAWYPMIAYIEGIHDQDKKLK